MCEGLTCLRCFLVPLLQPQISKVVLNCVIILRMVGGDVVYEKEIRSTLGNNPDTSKALRL